MSVDLGLDPSDPLNLLLHNSSQGADSSMEDSGSSQSEGATPPDWSQLTNLWSDVNDHGGALKPYSDLMDFTDLASLPMDMDFNPSMALEPSELHYDSMKYAPGLHFSYDDPSVYGNLSNELLAAQFPFTFQTALNSSGSTFTSSSSPSPQTHHKERRLSVGSSSSSSGASLSPVPESSPSPATCYTSDASQAPKQELSQNEEYLRSVDPAVQIAQRVRQSAGVMLAVPMSAQLQGHGANQQVSLPIMNQSQGKLPIPRLARHSAPPKSPASSNSSAASTPPPSTPPMQSHIPPKLVINASISQSEAPSSTVPTPVTAVPPPSASASTARPKTSHTTIERRYRTNLNARIQSLRMAVPALRVLEDRDGGNGKKIKKNLKGGTYVKGTGIGIDSEDGTVIDVIDERGFVDGVKVARKCSKANVLGKAVEYIRVLKKREQRLKSEQNGLKTLLSGLVGGPALLREWEQCWREQFGGEEKDEVEGDAEEGDDDDSDEEEGEDGEEETGRKRKRVKATTSAAAKKPVDKKPAPPPVTTLVEESGAQPAVPEKRKRGRPRKVVPPPVPVATLAPQVPQLQGQPAIQQDQMMLPPDAAAQEQWLREQQRQPQPQQYLLAVFAIFSFFNSPLTSSSHSSPHSAHQRAGVVLTPMPPLAYAPEIVSQFTAPPPLESAPAGVMNSWGWNDYAQVFHLLVSAVLLTSFACNWMGLTFGFGKRRIFGKNTSVRPSKSSSKTIDSMTDSVSVCDDLVLSGQSNSLSLFSQLQMYRLISSQNVTSTADLTSLAMFVSHMGGGVFNSLARAKARSIWDAAKSRSETTHLKRGVKLAVRTSETLVLETLDVTEAVERLASATQKDITDGERVLKPVEVLAKMLVKQRVKQHLGELFIDTVGAQDCEKREKEDIKREDGEIRRTVDAARELGGDIEELGRLLERIWKSSVLDDIQVDDTVEAEESEESDVDSDIKALLTALVTYRRIFASSTLDCSIGASALLSPPPSPTSKPLASKTSAALLSLRKALGNPVFEDEDKEGEMEDARDRVVDLIVDMERRGRSSSPQ